MTKIQQIFDGTDGQIWANQSNPSIRQGYNENNIKAESTDILTGLLIKLNIRVHC